MLIIHHTDFDGECAAFLVKKAMEPYPIEFMLMNYGWDIDWEKIAEHDVVYMVDFCFPDFNDMLKLKDMVDKFVWIDHHQTSYNKWKEAGSPEFDGLRVDGGKAGCELAFEHLFPDEEMPLFVHHVGRYDVWDHSDPKTPQFQYGLRTHETNPKAEVWARLYANEPGLVEKILDAGEAILKYEDQQNQYRGRSARTIQFMGYSVVALNLAAVNNRNFDHCYDPDEHDFMLAFSYSKQDEWRISLRSEKEIDISKIAKQFGGGGHPKAAGFRASTDQLRELGIIQ